MFIDYNNTASMVHYWFIYFLIAFIRWRWGFMDLLRIFGHVRNIWISCSTCPTCGKLTNWNNRIGGRLRVPETKPTFAPRCAAASIEY